MNSLKKLSIKYLVNKKIWYRFFLIFGLIGFLDLVLFYIRRELGLIGETNEIGSLVAIPLIYFFGTYAPSFVATLLISLQYWWIALLIAWAIKRTSSEPEAKN